MKDGFNVSFYLSGVSTCVWFIMEKIKINKYQEEELLSPYTPYTSQISFKKDFFIQSRTEDIKEIYNFYQKPIGRGGYGTVFRAKLKQPPYTDRVVKVINKRLIRNPEILLNEVNVLRKMDHPNIIKLYESFQDKSYLYLVTDLCEGGELFDRIDQEGCFDQTKARKIFVQIIKTLKYLHLQKICHRDLKAENFLFNNLNDDRITLIDFGLSYQWSNNMKQELVMTGNNKLVGTSYYVAPEVIAKNYDERCDIWSAGVLLHVILTATPPFSGDDDSQILNNIKKGIYQQNEQIVKLSPFVRDLLKKMLVFVDKRITLDQILQHPWIKIGVDKAPKLKLNFGKMKQVMNFSKLKTVFLAFISSQLPAKQIEQLSQLFRQIDKNNDGFLSVTQIENALKVQGIVTNYNQLNPVLKSMDLDKNGKINYNEFIASMVSDDYCQKKDYLDYIFQYFDADRNGKISRFELNDAIKKMGFEVPAKFINDLIMEADINKDEEISYDQFLLALKAK